MQLSLSNWFFHRVLQSFEEVVSYYAQQLSMNEKQTFTAPSLVVIAESVSSYTSEKYPPYSFSL